MARKTGRGKRRRRVSSEELKAEAVQMMLDGHGAESVAQNLGLSGANLLSRWKAKTGRYEVLSELSITSRLLDTNISKP